MQFRKNIQPVGNANEIKPTHTNETIYKHATETKQKHANERKPKNIYQMYGLNRKMEKCYAVLKNHSPIRPPVSLFEESRSGLRETRNNLRVLSTFPSMTREEVSGFDFQSDRVGERQSY